MPGFKPIIAASTGVLVPAPGQGIRTPVVDQAGIDQGLSAIAKAGFSAVEFSDIWLDSRSMSLDTAKLLATRAAAFGLTVVGLSTLGLDTADAALMIAETVGAPTLCLGLHQMPQAPAGVVSFWASHPAPPAPTDAAFESLAAGLRTLCQRSTDRGINVVIEMHENALIDRAHHVSRVLDMVGSEALSVNPDLGNLTRVSAPMPEAWSETLTALAPHTTYWHVKNNLRVDHPLGFTVTHPCNLADGIIDYRAALGQLRAAGFCGPIIVESYCGDRMHILQKSRIYLESLLNCPHLAATTP